MGGKLSSPPWWLTLLITLGGGGTVIGDSQLGDALKAVIVAVVGLVTAVYQVQHHRTIRNADMAAAAAVRPALDLNALAQAVAIHVTAAQQTVPAVSSPAEPFEPPTH